MLPEPCAVVVQLSGAWEEVSSIFVERDRHDPIGVIECELYSVSMVDVYVNI